MSVDKSSEPIKKKLVVFKQIPATGGAATSENIDGLIAHIEDGFKIISSTATVGAVQYILVKDVELS